MLAVFRHLYDGRKRQEFRCAIAPVARPPRTQYPQAAIPTFSAELGESSYSKAKTATVSPAVPGRGGTR